MKFATTLRRNLWRLALHSGVSRLLSDRTFTELLYWSYMGRRLNLEAPVDFNQKEQWLKLYYKNPLYITCADKYAVREFVKNRIGEKYLNTCIGVYSRVEDIDFGSLPDRFVLKATHGSGWNLVCSDKRSFDWNSACKTMRKWLSRDFSKVGCEWQYHAICPRIVCEAFLEETDKTPLRDYKLFTFNGETKYIAVEFDKPDGRHYVNVYNTEWEFQHDKKIGSLNDPSAVSAKPQCLGEMLDLAKALAVDFPMCRVDFYVIGGERVVFGELTFTPGKGCNNIIPQSFADELGSYIVCRKWEVGE